MRSELADMWRRHREEIDALRKRCKHPSRALKVSKDHSVVGLGTAWPSIHVTCRNCGTKKVMFRDWKSRNTKVLKTLKRQAGFRDQRLGCEAHHEWEIE